MPNDADPRERRAIGSRRVPQPWPTGRRFRILSIDGGGIRGIFPAAILAGLEAQYTGGRPISAFFDLVAGTSTGGIIALGLGAGYSASHMLALYRERGAEIFPPFPQTRSGNLRATAAWIKGLFRYRYDRDVLERILREKLGQRRLGDSSLRLCIPSTDGSHGSAYIFKTPHHADYKVDRHDAMLTVALATAAAPTFFRTLPHRAFELLDGGVWANNPTMIALVDALTCWDVARDHIDVLSLGCGEGTFRISAAQRVGGLLQWRNAFDVGSLLQSKAATNQARLLLGAPAVLRIDAPAVTPPIKLDDWRRADAELPSAAARAIVANGAAIATKFLYDEAEAFAPVPTPISPSSPTDTSDRNISPG